MRQTSHRFPTTSIRFPGMNTTSTALSRLVATTESTKPSGSCVLSPDRYITLSMAGMPECEAAVPAGPLANTANRPTKTTVAARIGSL